MKKSIIAVAIGLVLIAIIITFGQVFTVKFVSVEFENSVFCATEQEILAQTKINSGTNIFVLDEKKVTKAIENSYKDNEIKVVDIIREFPNSITIKVAERIAIYKIKAKTNDEIGYVSADRNFQRAHIYSAQELNKIRLINVTGYEVDGTYLTDECYLLRDVANALISCGIAEEALPYFIKSIDFGASQVTISLAPTDTIFILKKSSADVKSDVSSMFAKYNALSPSARNGITILP